jgi:AraC-like DNA-binding protein
LDLSSYDYIKIVLKSERGKRLPLTLSTYIDNFSKKDDYLTHRLMRTVVNTSTNFEEHILTLNQFTTPDWWFSLNQKSENEILADFSRTKFFNLNQSIDIPKNVLDRIEVKELSFHRDYQPFYRWSGMTLFLYYLGSLISYITLIKKKEKGNPSVHFNYQKVEVENHFEKEEESVFNFLTSNYPKQDLSISDLQNELGLYEQKISSIIKKKTGLSFKQFLNKLRLSEAQRLLLNSDLQVSEIAFKVGYGNVSHFNRVFKEAMGCSPNDFRKQQSLIQQ